MPLTLALAFVAQLGGLVAARAEPPRGPARFQPTWESVSVKDDAPEWLKDAKFGIYTHWGPQTLFGNVPIVGSVAYYNNMYDRKSAIHAYHKETYGDPATVGYKDIIDDFKAQDFDANQWADVFHDAGARFAGMVVVHHDNVAMWDSRLTPYNVRQLGPKRDITGELEKAYRGKGMHFLATFHNLASWGHSYLKAYEFDGKDGKAAALYNEPHGKSDPPSRVYLDRQLGLIDEVIERYRPDGIWFDYGLYNTLTEQDRLNLAARYYNWGQEHEKDVVFIHKHGSKLPTGILNTERGRLGELRDKTWMNDESIGVRYWFRNAERMKAAGNFSGKYLTHVIIDLASKNGIFLLNVAPDEHGVIPDDQREVLGTIGSWLKKYGEAIYKTRPWETYGEGPFQLRFRGKIGGKDPAQRVYSSEDIRFTRSKDGQTIYAIFMGPPKPSIPIQSMIVDEPALLPKCRWLGHGAVKVTANEDGHPVVDVASIEGDASGDFAYAIAIPAAAVRYSRDATGGNLKQVELPVDHAVITGKSIRLETIDADDGIRALRPWSDERDFLTWTVEIPAAGKWSVQASIRARRATKAKLILGAQDRTAVVAAQGIRLKPARTAIGSFTVEKPGTYSLHIKPARTDGKWIPFEIYGVSFKQE